MSIAGTSNNIQELNKIDGIAGPAPGLAPLHDQEKRDATTPTHHTTEQPTTFKVIHHHLTHPQDPSLLPTLSQLSAFLRALLPLRPRDVKFDYHTDRYRQSNQPDLPIARLVLSITPTPALYNTLNRYSRLPPLAFIHRPFELERSRVRKDATILSSHTGFDEALTVGYNVALATRLSLCVADSVCLQGYKNDATRRIGIVGVVPAGTTLGGIVRAVAREFELRGGDGGVEGAVDEQEVRVVAIMNAFAPAEVDRVMEAAVAKGWVEYLWDARKVLFLTGQAREAGMAAVEARGMKVMCVGHAEAEEWGMRYLAERVREEFPEVVVQLRVEEEEDPDEKAFLDRLAQEERLRDRQTVMY